MRPRRTEPGTQRHPVPHSLHPIARQAVAARCFQPDAQTLSSRVPASCPYQSGAALVELAVRVAGNRRHTEFTEQEDVDIKDEEAACAEEAEPKQPRIRKVSVHAAAINNHWLAGEDIAAIRAIQGPHARYRIGPPAFAIKGDGFSRWIVTSKNRTGSWRPFMFIKASRRHLGGSSSV
ncbi:hypothetical protein TI39_contig324g00005 [Zymoseptoria brevis]|uniref:Uncharacterized protein n=1 Tax=Zymoseptoria brevis TaxID=1047168 RepID=A0A0F4GTZ6_9PEZI|nr:hypothetical protein TI39_contig324g00005 [Zymoseptoria brevis]